MRVRKLVSGLLLPIVLMGLLVGLVGVHRFLGEVLRREEGVEAWENTARQALAQVRSCLTLEDQVARTNFLWKEAVQDAWHASPGRPDTRADELTRLFRERIGADRTPVGTLFYVQRLRQTGFCRSLVVPFSSGKVRREFLHHVRVGIPWSGLPGVSADDLLTSHGAPEVSLLFGHLSVRLEAEALPGESVATHSQRVMASMIGNFVGRNLERSGSDIVFEGLESTFAARCRGMFGETAGIRVLADHRRGILCPVVFRGQESWLLWDFLSYRGVPWISYAIIFPHQPRTIGPSSALLSRADRTAVSRTDYPSLCALSNRPGRSPTRVHGGGCQTSRGAAAHDEVSRTTAPGNLLPSGPGRGLR